MNQHHDKSVLPSELLAMSTRQCHFLATDILLQDANEAQHLDLDHIWPDLSRCHIEACRSSAEKHSGEGTCQGSHAGIRYAGP